jgi:hypothetical protein
MRFLSLTTGHLSFWSRFFFPHLLTSSFVVALRFHWKSWEEEISSTLEVVLQNISVLSHNKKQQHQH